MPFTPKVRVTGVVDNWDPDADHCMFCEAAFVADPVFEVRTFGIEISESGADGLACFNCLEQADATWSIPKPY